MSAEITNARQTRGLAGDLRAPWIGLLAFLIAFMWKPAAHTLSVVNHLLMPGGAHYLSGAVIGVAGFVLVWMGFRRDELTATGLGFMGGSFIFMGLVEPSFQLFAELMGVAPLMQEGATALSPNLLLMQASAISYFVVLIFLGADKDTRCRMFLWFHRNLKLRPNAPTPGYRRQPARIARCATRASSGALTRLPSHCSGSCSAGAFGSSSFGWPATEARPRPFATLFRSQTSCGSTSRWAGSGGGSPRYGLSPSSFPCPTWRSRRCSLVRRLSRCLPRTAVVNLLPRVAFSCSGRHRGVPRGARRSQRGTANGKSVACAMQSSPARSRWAPPKLPHEDLLFFDRCISWYWMMESARR